MAVNKRLVNFIEGPLSTHYIRLLRLVNKHSRMMGNAVADEFLDALIDMGTTMESGGRIARGKKPLPHSPDLKGGLLHEPRWGVGKFDLGDHEEKAEEEEDDEDWGDEEWDDEDPEAFGD